MWYSVVCTLFLMDAEKWRFSVLMPLDFFVDFRADHFLLSDAVYDGRSSQRRMCESTVLKARLKSSAKRETRNTKHKTTFASHLLILVSCFCRTKIRKSSVTIPREARTPEGIKNRNSQ
jgi:hypothetical protein